MLLPKGELTITIPRDGYLTSKRPGLMARIDGVETPIDGRVPVSEGQRVAWIENEARGLGDLLLHFGR